MCRVRKRHFREEEHAETRLRQILADPRAWTERPYVPTRVIRCRCRRWVLTSRSAKPWKAGKGGGANAPRRNRRAR